MRKIFSHRESSGDMFEHTWVEEGYTLYKSLASLSSYRLIILIINCWLSILDWSLILDYCTQEIAIFEKLAKSCQNRFLVQNYIMFNILDYWMKLYWIWRHIFINKNRLRISIKREIGQIHLFFHSSWAEIVRRGRLWQLPPKLWVPVIYRRPNCLAHDKCITKVEILLATMKRIYIPRSHLIVLIFTFSFAQLTKSIRSRTVILHLCSLRWQNKSPLQFSCLCSSSIEQKRIWIWELLFARWTFAKNVKITSFAQFLLLSVYERSENIIVFVLEHDLEHFWPILATITIFESICPYQSSQFFVGFNHETVVYDQSDLLELQPHEHI